MLISGSRSQQQSPVTTTPTGHPGPPRRPLPAGGSLDVPRASRCRSCNTHAHSFLDCPKKCVNCHAMGHTGNHCPVPCQQCRRTGGHYYPYCKNSAMAFPIILAATATHNIMTRHLQIADHVAVIGFDTCSDHNIVSAEFLCNNNIFPVMQPFDQLLLGLAGHTAVLGLATLAVQFPTGLDHVTFLVIPTLPGPLQALLGKPWLQQRRCVLDLGNDRIQFYGTANTALTLSVLSSSPLPVATSVPLITTGIPGLIKHQ